MMPIGNNSICITSGLHARERLVTYLLPTGAIMRWGIRRGPFRRSFCRSLVYSVFEEKCAGALEMQKMMFSVKSVILSSV